MAHVVNIGNAEVGKKPKVVSVISGKDAPKLAAESRRYEADLLELRIDLYEDIYSHPNFDKRIEKYIKDIKSESALPVIATIRRAKELGKYFEPEDTRINLFKSLASHVECIDIELEAYGIRDEVIRYAKSVEKPIPIIVSHHNIDENLDFDTLKTLEEKIISTKADIGKICVLAKSEIDVRNLLALTLHSHEIPLATISLGWIGKASRYIFPFFGSCLTYGYVGEPVVPGQFHIKELRYFLDHHDPRVIEDIVENEIDNVWKEELSNLLLV